MTEADVLILGAGMAGLAAAKTLADRNIKALILDEGANVGGRLSSRSIRGGLADHGAQFFTTREQSFARIVQQWLMDGVVFEWSRGWSDGSLMRTPTDGHPRYAVHGGMTRLARYIADSLGDTVRILTESRVTAIALENGAWAVKLEDGRRFRAHSAVLTAPVPQTLKLLDAGDVPLHDADREFLSAMDYDPSLCGLFWIVGDVHLPEPGALQNPNAAITWMADNERKGISPGVKIVTVQAGPEYSRRYYARDDDAALDRLRTELLPLLASGTIIMEAHLVRWRYAAPQTVYDQRYYRLQDLPACLIGGDAFGGPRVEGAYLSGMAIADAIVGELP